MSSTNYSFYASSSKFVRISRFKRTLHPIFVLSLTHTHSLSHALSVAFYYSKNTFYADDETFVQIQIYICTDFLFRLIIREVQVLFFLLISIFFLSHTHTCNLSLAHKYTHTPNLSLPFSLSLTYLGHII